MRLTVDEIWRSTLIIAGTALAWLAVFNLNAWLFSQAAFSERANWIFLPAALRIIFILLFQGRGAVGLIFGAYLTLPHTNPDDFSYEILLAVSSGLAPLIAVVFCQQFFTVHSELEGLNGWHIIALSIASATANAIILNALLERFPHELTRRGFLLRRCCDSDFLLVAGGQHGWHERFHRIFGIELSQRSIAG